mgnify:CR=1 FL=1
MLRTSLAVSLALILAAPACDNKPKVDPAAQAEELKRDLSNAMARVKDEKYEEAEAMLNRVLAAEPENALALAAMGRVRLGTKKYPEALGLLERAAQKLPDDVGIQASLGEAYTKLDRPADAATAYAAAFKGEPANGNYGLLQGQALRKVKQLDKAEEVLREVAKTDAQTEFVYTELGDVLREEGKLDESLKSYMKALIEHPGDKSAHAGAAEVYALQGNHRKAIDEYSTYIRMDCCSDFSNKTAKPRIAELQAAAAAAPPATP